MIGFETTVHTHGPLFSPRANRIVDEMADDVEEEVSAYAYDQVQSNLRASLKQPTGHYQSRVRHHQVGSRWQVDDDNVVYGPWLEDGKNRRRTRFKGYQAFRRAADAVGRESHRLAERVVHRELRRLS